MEINHIVTHPGVFHADDVIAVALIAVCIKHEAKLHRRFPTPEDLDDCKTVVIDTGKAYDVGRRNFDHHQDASLPAASSLVAEWLHEDGYLSAPVLAKLKAYLLDYVSGVDTGIIPGGGDSHSISGIIRAMNNIPDHSDVGFSYALEATKTILRGYISQAIVAAEAELRWLVAPRPMPHVVRLTSGFIPDWQKLAEAEDVWFLLSPNSQEPGKWQIISRDSSKWPIPAHELQTFRHNSGFMAVYGDEGDAGHHLLDMIIDYKRT